MKKFITLSALTICTLLGVPAWAESFTVQGRVVDVAPVMKERRIAEEAGDCAPVRPAGGASLVSILRWDLRTDCRTLWREESYVDGWTVWYEWEGDVYSSVFDEKPGETVALRLTMN